MIIQNFAENIKEVEDRLSSPEQMLGKGLLEPFNNTNSGSRKILFSTQVEHSLNLIKPEVPIIQTGYENRFGDMSSSVIKTEDNLLILAKICKFERRPNDDYILIYQNMKTKQLDYIERKSYNHNTESYGYLFNNGVLDSLQPNSIVPSGETIRKSTGFDEYNNRCDGVNLLTTYIAKDKTMEDGISISETAANKLASPLIKHVVCNVNDNDILLNLMGDDTSYKSFPDIGEEIQNGILLGVRREKLEDALFMQSKSLLRKTVMGDEKYTITGKVIDINIKSNSPDKLANRNSNSQLYYYYNNSQRYFKEIVDTINQLMASGYNDLSSKLKKLHYQCRIQLEGVQYIDNRVFNGTVLDFYVLEINVPTVGDKLSNRYGGKGVISEVVPDNMMPLLENGKHIEVIYNSSTCVNRENDGQLKEMSLTHIASRIIDFIGMNVLTYDEAISLILEYLYLVSPEQAKCVEEYLDRADAEYRRFFVDSIMDNEELIVSLKPITESLTIDQIAEIYEHFPWIRQYTTLVPMTSSNGQTRYIKSRRPITAGRMYIYRLKQYAEEKFSVTSLSSTNLRNENSRNKANKNFKALYPNTPIRFGEMESGDLSNIGTELVKLMMMLYSSSPHGRMLVQKLYTDDPYEIDIKLDEESVDRSAELFNVYFKTIGLVLKFIKKPKKFISPVLYEPVVYDDPNKYVKPVMYVSEEEKGFDILKDTKEQLERKERADKYPVMYEAVLYVEDEKEANSYKEIITKEYEKAMKELIQ